MKSKFVLILFSIPLLAGCFGGNPPAIAPDASCDAWIPYPTAGDNAVFTARGAPWSMDLNLLPIVDWGIANGGAGQGGTMILPPESELAISISPPELRLTKSGNMEDAFGISYQARRAADSQPTPFADAWISKTDGAVIQATLRSIFLSGASPYHDIRLTHEEKPALFASQLYWGTQLNASSKGTIQMASDQPTSLWVPGKDRLEWRVHSAALVEATCEVALQLQYEPASVDAALPAWSVTMTFRHGVPVPIQYQATPATVRDPIFEMKLDEYRAANGTLLPAWRPTQRPAGVALGIPEAGFLAETAQTFLTPWTIAMEAMKSNPTSSSWLEEHGNAVPVYVAHINGEPESNFVDAWRIHWTDGNAGNLMIVEHRKPLLDLLGDSINVISTPEAPYPLPPDATNRISLGRYAETFRSASGQEPEVLNCNLALDYCGIGTHVGTAYPAYNGTWPSSSPHIGLLVDLTDGMVLTDQSASESML